MKITFIYTAFFFCLMIVTSPSYTQVQSKSFNLTLKTILAHDVPEITIKEAMKKMDNYYLLDAREKEEYNVSHLKDALFVGYDYFNLTSVKDLPKNKPIIVYCSIGKRSEDITRKLKKAGYLNVQNLYGGIFEWVNEGNPVYDLQEKPTDKVHVYGKFWSRFLNKGTKIY